MFVCTKISKKPNLYWFFLINAVLGSCYMSFALYVASSSIYFYDLPLFLVICWIDIESLVRSI